MTPEELKRFDEASNHPYECGCEICLEWWDAVGPEEEDDDIDGELPCGCDHVDVSCDAPGCPLNPSSTTVSRGKP